MALLGNILWFVLGGWLVFLFYLLGAIVFFPMFIPLFRLAVYAAWPFGRSVVSKRALDRYRELTGASFQASGLEQGARAVSGVLNVLWMLSFGWVLALTHFLCAILNILTIWMIVTIPNIAGHWKLMKVALMPFNKVIVPQTLADEMTDRFARAKLNL